MNRRPRKTTEPVDVMDLGELADDTSTGRVQRERRDSSATARIAKHQLDASRTAQSEEDREANIDAAASNVVAFVRRQERRRCEQVFAIERKRLEDTIERFRKDLAETELELERTKADRDRAIRTLRDVRGGR